MSLEEAGLIVKQATATAWTMETEQARATAAMQSTLDTANLQNTMTVAQAQAQAEAAAIAQAAEIARAETEIAFSATKSAATNVPVKQTQQAAYTATKFSADVSWQQGSNTNGLAIGLAFAFVLVAASTVSAFAGLSWIQRLNERHNADINERQNMAVANTVRPVGERVIIFVVNGEVHTMPIVTTDMTVTRDMGQLQDVISGEESTRRAGWRLAARRVAGWSRVPGYERQADFSRDKLCGEGKLNALSYQDYPRLISFLEELGQVVNDSGGTRYATGCDYDTLMACLNEEPLPYPKSSPPKVAPVGRTTPEYTGNPGQFDAGGVVLEGRAAEV